MATPKQHVVNIDLLNTDRLRGVEAGSLLVLATRVTCTAGCDLSGHSVIANLGSRDSTLHVLVGFDVANGSMDINDIVVATPDVVGESSATIRFPATAIAGFHHEECATSFSIVMKPVATSLSIWDVPRPIVIGERFVVHSGLKSSLGLSLAGATITVFDADGLLVGGRAVEDQPIKNSHALYGSAIELIAPTVTGDCTWSVSSDVSAVKHPHEGSLIEFRLLVVSPPQYTLQISVTDDSGDVGIAGTLLRLGPYQQTTNAQGSVEFRVPGGSYLLQSWHPDYELISRELVVAGNATYRFAIKAVSSVGDEFP